MPVLTSSDLPAADIAQRRTGARLRFAVAVVGWLALALLGVAALLREVAPERSRWLILLAVLTPLLYLPAWVVAVAAAVARRWRLLAVAVAFVALHVWWTAPLLWGGRGQIDNPTSTATVVSVNLNSGRPTGAAVASLIVASGADIAVLSEASPVSVAGLGASGLPVVAEDVTDGWMVLSRWPVVSQTKVTIDDQTMPRLVLRRPDGGEVVVWQAHPMDPAANGVDRWRRQIAEVRHAIAADRSGATPVVVAGDFNATADLPSFHVLLDDGWVDTADGHGLMPTWRVGGRLPPLLRLDHVLVSRQVGVKSVHRSPSVGSDHLGLVVVLQFAQR